MNGAAPGWPGTGHQFRVGSRRSGLGVRQGAPKVTARPPGPPKRPALSGVAAVPPLDITPAFFRRVHACAHLLLPPRVSPPPARSWPRRSLCTAVKVFDSRRRGWSGAPHHRHDGRKIAQVLPGRVPVPGAREWTSRATPARRAGSTCTVHLASQSGPRSYEERFRLDDADYPLRAVGARRETLRPVHHSARPRGEVTLNGGDAINAGRG